MRTNADFTKRAAVHAAKLGWTPSPMAGVERKMLDRIGGEVARATSIVRYAPGSYFSPHTHDGGEEFLVLEGTFQDEHGDYPAGTYVRNPPGTRHTPRSDNGCTIFVKLWQFDPEDRVPVVTALPNIAFESRADLPGAESASLSARAYERVRFENWEPNRTISYLPDCGIEILCLEGSFIEGNETFSRESWLRLPPGAPLEAMTPASGCLVWIKEGHLHEPMLSGHLGE